MVRGCRNQSKYDMRIGGFKTTGRHGRKAVSKEGCATGMPAGWVVSEADEIHGWWEMG